MRDWIDPEFLSFRTRDLPAALWMELTSKCPFDCVFCSRKTRHGLGEHMDFGLYKAILGQLWQPEVIRLNYSGESVHYPRLTDAVAEAKATGAGAELVTALASASPALIEGLVHAGLDRITISVHAAEEAAFHDIYRFSSFEALRERMELLTGLSRVRGGRPVIDFAFVAADRNVDQLPGVASLAQRHGVRRIMVQPVAYRDPIPYRFVELDRESRIQDAFKSRLRAAMEETGRLVPAIELLVTDPDALGCQALSERPRAYPAPLPPGAGVFSCFENPWETAHILTNGDVVTCGWRDDEVLGNLRSQSLREVWQGAPYYRFRQEYSEGRDTRCRACHWKEAYRAGPLRTRLTSVDDAPAQFLSGWYADNLGQPLWSGQSAKLVLGRPEGACTLHARGQLLAGRRPNRLRIMANGSIAGDVTALAGTKVNFDLSAPIDAPPSKPLRVEFRTDVTVVPARDFGLRDTRALGFCLFDVEMDNGACPPYVTLDREAVTVPRRLSLLRGFLTATDAAGRRLPSRSRARPARSRASRSGVTVIIPERDNQPVLANCLAGLAACRDSFPEALEALVVVNGAEIAEYSGLRERLPWVRWLHRREPLGFSSAVRLGLRAAQHEWVYLLNSDMVLAPDALQQLLPYRNPDVFAIGSQIFFRDQNRVRQESNLVGYCIEEGMVRVFHRAPARDEFVAPTLLAGGGSSLFQRRLLGRFVGRRDVYNPFYFEDAEWSMLAHREGYRVLFCARSHCWHEHRATVLKFYPAGEVDRLFERHRLKWQLRNWLHPGSCQAALHALAVADEKTVQELTSFREIASILAGRLRAWCAPEPWKAPPGLAPSPTPAHQSHRDAGRRC